jgi:Mrp family chromosome partitioning ATPase
MVCITGGITYNELTTASEMLKTARVPLLGVVLNDVVPSRRAKSFKTDFSLADR